MSTATAAPIGWFEIATADADTAEAFYSEVFGWSFSDDSAVPSYRIVDTGEGSLTGGVTTAQAGTPETYAIFSMMVPDVAATCAAVETKGGSVLVGPQTVPDTGLVFANLTDPDGNHFGVFSPPAQ